MTWWVLLLDIGAASWLVILLVIFVGDSMVRRRGLQQAILTCLDRAPLGGYSEQQLLELLAIVVSVPTLGKQIRKLFEAGYLDSTCSVCGLVASRESRTSCMLSSGSYTITARGREQLGRKS